MSEATNHSNQREDPDENPLLARDVLPRFGDIRPGHVVPAVNHMLAKQRDALKKLEGRPGLDWNTLMVPLEDIAEAVHACWGPVSHLMGVQNSPELRAAYETVQPEIVDFQLQAGQSRALFSAMKKLSGDTKLSPAQQRILSRELLQMRHAGIELEGPAQIRFNEIARELSALSTRFSNNVLDSTKAFALELHAGTDVEGLPPSSLELARAAYAAAHSDDGSASKEGGPYRFTLDVPSFLPFMQHARSRNLRRELYMAYVGRASAGEFDNTEIVRSILRLRREEAALLGYETPAELSLAEKMAGGVEAVRAMEEQLLAASRGAAEADLAEIRLRARRDGIEDVSHWDIAFYAERLREERFGFTDEELRPYFPLPRVLDGLFRLVRDLFGVRVEPADGEAAVWHPDVRYFKILDESGAQLAAFFLDPYSRPADKRGGAWMDDCLGRRRTPGRLTLPVAYLVCNGTPPMAESPSLLTFGETETLFHEFGHGLQHMLTTVEYPSAAGINGVEWDAVELPSQFMENWCYHRATLLSLTRHVKTGEQLPDTLFEKLLAARTFRAGSEMLRQIRLGLVDLELHDRYDPDGDESPFDVQKRIDERTSLLPPLETDRFLCSFGHIFAGGYAAGYYSYKWAEVMSADAFGAFEDVGLENSEQVAATGRRFRATVLSLGGSRHPADVFRDFRGRDPNPDALLRQYGLVPASA